MPLRRSINQFLLFHLLELQASDLGYLDIPPKIHYLFNCVFFIRQRILIRYFESIKNFRIQSRFFINFSESGFNFSFIVFSMPFGKTIKACLLFNQKIFYFIIYACKYNCSTRFSYLISLICLSF